MTNEHLDRLSEIKARVAATRPRIAVLRRALQAVPLVETHETSMLQTPFINGP